MLQHTGLNSNQLQHGLALLVQEHLAFWYTSAEHGRTEYEANAINCYNLVRIAKYVEAVEERFGKLAGELVAEVAQVGHVRTDDLMYGKVEQYDGSSSGRMNGDRRTEAGEHQRNGSVAPHANGLYTPESAKDIRTALSGLLDSGLLCITHESHFRTNSDNRTEAESLAPQISKLDAKMTKTALAAYEKAITSQLEVWKYGVSVELGDSATVKGGNKRALADDPSEHRTKRQRLTNGTSKWQGGDISVR